MLNTNDSVTRSFLRGDNIVLHINNLAMGSYGHLAEYIGSLNWYHNGTEITNMSRISITNNGTSLSISNMIDSDAGKYEVKIGSYGSSSQCDQNLLPALQILALHAPVTFIVQQSHIPKYNPEDVIKVFTLDSTIYHLIINNSIEVNINRIHLSITDRYFFKNGVSQSLDTKHFNFTRSYGSEILLSHQIRYNNTEDVAGHYVYDEVSYSHYILHYICPSFYYYIRRHSRIPVFILYWTLQENGEML